MNRLEEQLNAAIDAVSAAVDVARAVQQDLDRVRQITKDDHSPVTVADYAVQAIVARSLIKACGGSVRITGEESAGALREPANAAVRAEVVEAVRRVEPEVSEAMVLDAIDHCDHDATATSFWTLDPVDGTKGFLRGEQYAIALGLIDAGRVTVGVLGCPNISVDHDRAFDDPDPQGTIFTATTGGGCRAWRADGGTGDGRAVHASRGDGPVIRICESVETAHSRHSDTRRVLEHLGLEIATARLDSQCKYAVVARGQAEAYLRMPTRKGYVEKIWDHAAGMLVATEAGARVSDITGAPLDFTRGRQLEANRGIVCASEGIHDRLIEAISTLGLTDVLSAP